MTYDLRRLRHRGFIHRIPHTFRYHVTDTGLAHALFLTRLHDRFLRTGLGQPRRSHRLQLQSGRPNPRLHQRPR